MTTAKIGGQKAQNYRENIYEYGFVKVKENRLKMADNGYFISTAFHQIHATNTL